MTDSRGLLRRLKKAVEKVKFLLSFSATRWLFSSLSGSSSSSHRLSFKGQPGLLDCVDNYITEEESSFRRSSSVISRTTSTKSAISRTTSDSSTYADDIDRRADMFIANFYKHIKMERQVSLELRYSKGKGLERTWSG